MPKLDRDGVNIYYEVHGSGPPLLLTHGYSSTSAMWRGQIDALSKDHTLILWGSNMGNANQHSHVDTGHFIAGGASGPAVDGSK